MSSPVPFAVITIKRDNAAICFNASQLMTTTFHFIGASFVCDKALLSIADVATEIAMNSFGTIPPSLLQFSKLKQLTFYDGMSCTCALAKYFYLLANSVPIVATCNDNMQQVDNWILANYDRCKDTTEELPEYDKPQCKMNCLVEGASDTTSISTITIPTSKMRA